MPAPRNPPAILAPPAAGSATALPLFACVLSLAILAACSRPEPGTYRTPEEAVAAAEALIGAGDDAKTEEVFGPGSAELFRSGDDDEDRRLGERVKALIAEKVAFEDFDENTRVAVFGEAAWPFPIPLVRVGKRWRFDTEAGREELLNRRIGYFELWTLTSLQEYVDAQNEYAAEGHDGNPRAFAQRFMSSEGRRDGLFWPPVEGEPSSPLGDLMAAAGVTEGEAQPFNGYHYRILTGQGEHAFGGARSYLDGRGQMTGGFAAKAWPAEYGSSGVMTFLVSHHDIVFQKDLGPETDTLARAIEVFDPDPSWEPTADTLTDLEDLEWPVEEEADEEADEEAEGEEETGEE
jgi:hypothetical protein